MIRVLLVTAALGVLPLPCSGQDTDPSASETFLAQYVAAYNRHDIAAMLELVADDFTWYTVTSDSVAVELRSRAALERSLKSYFGSLPSARSEIEGPISTGPFIAFRERAIWTSRNGVERSQRALGVYEIREGRLLRAWYYPLEP